MTELLEPVRIRIDAPDAPSAFELERRLVYHNPTAVSHHEHWQVELEGDEQHVDEVIATVRRWLADERLAETVIQTDGRSRHVRSRR